VDNHCGKQRDRSTVAPTGVKVDARCGGVRLGVAADAHERSRHDDHNDVSGCMVLGGGDVIPRKTAGAAAMLAALAVTIAGLVAAPAAVAQDAAAPLPAAQPGTIEQCAGLADFAFADTTITRAEAVPAGVVGGVAVGAHCLVQGRMNDRVSEVDGQAYAIGFEMRLPDAWNGRYLYQGNGGMDGSVSPALGSVGNGESGLQMGFAVISSDAGHSGAQNPTFGLDPQARLDYGYQAVGTLTPMAKALITDAYGRGPDRSYMTGGSNGGRHTMVAASRYADEYDGFLAVAPGFNLPQAAVAQIWGAQRYATVATDTTDLNTAFTVAERQTVAAAVLARCDGLDGLADGMVQAIDRCQAAFSFERDVPTCAEARTGDCLTTEQKTVVADIFRGARTSDGTEIYSSFPVDPGLAQSGWAFWEFFASAQLDPSAVGYVFTSPPDAPPLGDLRGYALSVDVDRIAQAIYEAAEPYSESAMSFMTPPDATELATLRERGGKLIVVHGASDGVFSPDDSAEWFEQLDADAGGDAEAFAQYYEVPGMGHVRGGPATDQFPALAALVDWVEQGQAPQALTATVNPSNPELPGDWSKTRSRPLCPYPSTAVYVSGDPESAESFVCSDSAAPIAITAPVVTGQPDVGRTLTASTGEWSGEEISYSYQWLRNGEPIRRATSAEYRVSAADQGAQLSVRVTAANADGEAAETSDAVVVRWVTVSIVTAKPVVVSAAGKSVTVTVKVLPNKAHAAGDVSVTVAGRTVTGTVTEGVATIDVGTLPRGIHPIVTSYAGSDTAAPSRGVGLVVVLR
jgi:feruloyl esterase